jgi:hypothetical protein
MDRDHTDPSLQLGVLQLSIDLTELMMPLRRCPRQTRDCSSRLCQHPSHQLPVHDRTANNKTKQGRHSVIQIFEF